MIATNYKKVFQLAQDKGYNLKFVKTIESVIPEGWELFRVKEYYKGKLDVKVRRLYPEGEIKWNEDGYEYDCIFIDKEPDEQTALIELTLIQKWLRDVYRLLVTIGYIDKQYISERISIEDGVIRKRIFCNSYEYALLEGIHEALKLI